MTDTSTPPKCPQSALYAFGLCLRILNKLRRELIGYTTPRPFSPTHIERNIRYTLDVAEGWRKYVSKYTGEAHPFCNKHVLELGPGQDLGTGLVLLANGAKSYTSIDKNRLIHKTPMRFYYVLLEHLEELPGYARAKETVDCLQRAGTQEHFCYIWDPAFQLNRLASKRYDLVVSHRVLEHIVDIEKTFDALSSILSGNAVMVHEIDLVTHTRIVRELDPLNLLRYSKWIWKVLRFDGSPNRMRMNDYCEILRRLRYKDVVSLPVAFLDDSYVRRAKSHLWGTYKRTPEEDLTAKSFYLLARKDDPENARHDEQ
jgi:hypothetical protein